MRKLLLTLLLGCQSLLAFAAPADVGVIYLHGKEGMPAAKINTEAIKQLQAAGFRVLAPEMAWSRQRIYDTDVATSMAEIDTDVQALRTQGARRVVLVGHSMGANAAIRYAATHGLDGLVLLAPGHNPEALSVRQLAPDVARARQLIAEGKAAEKNGFKDVNVGRNFSVSTTPQIYLSWFDPAGDAVMARNAAAVTKPLPVLLITGSRDPVGKSKNALFDKFPAHVQSRFVVLDVDHKEVPEAGAAQIVEWLKAL